MINSIMRVAILALAVMITACDGYEPSATGAYKEPTTCETCRVTNPALTDRR